MQNTPERNPCFHEQEITFKCFNDNNFNKEACSLHIENYRRCKDFWGTVRRDRRRNGIRPIMPPLEEREAIKKQYQKIT